MWLPTMNNCVILLSLFFGMSDKVFSKSKVRSFPPGFWFGAGTSAYQVEGGWNEDGKSFSIWDVACHTDPESIQDGTNGDDTADSYHKYQSDVEAAKQTGLEYYRFSIAWTRILPSGLADKINSYGVNYYNNLIDSLLAKNITPLVTMYHWDLPYSLQKLGGWSNPLSVDWFASYAKVLFEKFGEKVKHWITINDPKKVCVEGYGSDAKAPYLNWTGVAEYLCSRNILLAHAKAYHLYDEYFRKLQNGSVGISIGFVWYEPASDTFDDHQAAVDAREFDWGIYAHPIFTKSGDFPQEVKKNVAFKSADQGYPQTRLLELTANEVALLRGSADFLGVNTFMTRLAYRDASLEGMYPAPSFMDDMSAVLIKDPSWTQAEFSWQQDVPWGLFKLLNEIRIVYDNPPVYIIENGWVTSGGLVDEDRISYLRNSLNALLDAVEEGCDIKGYVYWSLIDTFEWQFGHAAKFGLYEVDYGSPGKTRTPRKSAFIYKEIIRTKALDPDFEPEKFIVEVDSPDKGKDNDVM